MGNYKPFEKLISLCKALPNKDLEFKVLLIYISVSCELDSVEHKIERYNDRL